MLHVWFVSSLPVLLLGLERGDQPKRKRETKSKWIIVSIHQSPFYLSSSSSSPPSFLAAPPSSAQPLSSLPSPTFPLSPPPPPSPLPPSQPPPPPLPPSQPPPFSCHLSSSVVDEVLAREKTRKLKARQIRGARSPPHIHPLTTHSHLYPLTHPQPHPHHTLSHLYPLTHPQPHPHTSPPSSLYHLSYRIAGNFRGRKLSRIGENMIFAEKTFVDCSLLPCWRTPHPKFRGENFRV